MVNMAPKSKVQLSQLLKDKLIAPQ